MNEIKTIECKKIGAPKGPKLNESTLDYLYDSIKTEGLYNPIVVRPDPAKPGQYLIVQGRHRFHVWSKLLGEESIEARIFEDMDEAEARLASLTENVCRNAPAKADRYILIQEWQELYKAKYPDLIGRRAGGKRASEKRWGKREGGGAKREAVAVAGKFGDAERHSDAVHDAEAEAAAPVAEPEPVAGAGSGADPATFNERVQASTGQSRTSVTRDIRIANGFDKDQLQELEAAKVGKLDLLKILKYTKDNKLERNEIVNLVLMKTPVDEAIKEVTGQNVVKDDAGRESEVGESEKGSAVGALEAQLSDDEWFATFCGEKARLLGDTERYKADALLFRKIGDHRAAFRKKVKKTLAAYREERRGKTVGWFFLTLNTLLNASHPENWLLCDSCAGRGKTSDGTDCKKCRGACYAVKTERYL